jgi:hypothetical protein
MIHPLSRPHVSILGAPTLDRVDDVVFVCRYFTHCLSCTFCEDACCKHGVDVDEPTMLRILAHGSAIEDAIGVPRDAWFLPDLVVDSEHPGGRYTRTRVRDGYCVFRTPSARGCALHRHALASGIDYHDLKPMVSALFPLTFDEGLLHASTEVEDGTLICGGEGPTLYRGAREELAYYFGEALVRELDTLDLKCPNRA